MLDDFCLPHLTGIIENCSLSSLEISRCNLTKSLFRTDRIKFSTTVRRSGLKYLDASYNNLSSGLETLLTSLPVGILRLDLKGCSLEPASNDLIISSLLSHCSQVSSGCDLEILNLSSLHLTDTNLERLSSCLTYCKKMTSLHIDHNCVTSRGLSFLIEAVVKESLPLCQLTCASMGASSDFWINEEKFISDKLEAFLEKKSTAQPLRFVLPSPKDGLTASFTKVWDRYHGSKSKHHRDGLGNLVLCLD